MSLVAQAQRKNLLGLQNTIYRLMDRRKIQLDLPDIPPHVFDPQLDQKDDYDELPEVPFLLCKS